jgi:hypothetical protein
VSKKNSRKQKKSKARRAAQRKTTYDPKVRSKYAQKKMLQAKGEFSPNSPFRIVNHITAEAV